MVVHSQARGNFWQLKAFKNNVNCFLLHLIKALFVTEIFQSLF